MTTSPELLLSLRRVQDELANASDKARATQSNEADEFLRWLVDAEQALYWLERRWLFGEADHVAAPLEIPA